ncbi:hypothetical protein [Bradyrhizobium sp. USDA 3256]
MANVNRVLRSINDEAASRCVDIFLRPDGSIGFEEYRRDVEDGSGWFPVGGHSHRIFHGESAALAAAIGDVAWLRRVVGST